jgi:hypothetical protein
MHLSAEKPHISMTPFSRLHYSAGRSSSLLVRL